MDHLTLTGSKFESVVEYLTEAVSKRLEDGAQLQQGQAFGAEFINIIVEQILVPALVTGGALIAKDGMKAAYASIKKAGAKLIGTRIDPEAPARQNAIAEMQSHLGPLGFSNEEIEAICQTVRERLQHRG